jgi:citrate synthase
MNNSYWESAISHTSVEEIRIRGYDILELIGNVPFSHALYLIFMGELPTPEIGRVMDALLVASIDHGPGTPSALAARTAASGGAPLKTAAAAGLLSLDRYHGAAVEDCMATLEEVVELSKTLPVEDAVTQAAEQIVLATRAAGEKIFGFGHRQHRYDHRVDRLFELAEQAGVEGIYMKAARAISNQLEQAVGKPLPINIDGAVAAILSELNFPKGLGNAPFLVARFTGILAHANEEIEKMPRMRRIDPLNYGYCGPKSRTLSEKSNKG